jgi:filamentous hemagglutinin family protein
MIPDGTHGHTADVLRRSRRNLRLAGLAWLLLAPLTATAQIPGLVVRDDSLGAGKGQVVAPGIDPNGDAADYLITPDLGQQIGNTLLHSLWDFGLATDEVATFTGGDFLQYIVARITGGRVSHINGTIRSTAANADLYMINPSGFVFGQNSALDVPGSFHVTTADYLRWGDERFEAHEDGLVPTLAFAEPTAFGFFDADPGAVRFEATTLAVDPDQTFSVIGGDIALDLSTLRARSGEIRVVSVASEGEVVTGALDDVPDSFDQLGTIRLGNSSQLETSGEGGGSIAVRSDSLQLDGVNAALRANTGGGRDGIGIDVVVDDLVINGHGSGIFANSAGAGNGGSIELRVGTLRIRDGGRLGINVSSSGSGGAINVAASELVDVSGFSQRRPVIKSGIKSFSFTGATGGGVVISIESPELRVTDSAEIFSEARGGGPAGAIEVDVDRLVLQRGGRLSAVKLGAGAGADILVTASESIVIEGLDPTFTCLPNGDPCTTAIQAFVGPDATNAKGGDIVVETPILLMRESGFIFTDTGGAAAGGSIDVDVATLTMESGARLSTVKNGTGAAGSIDVHATESVSIAGSDPDLLCVDGAACFSGMFASSFLDGSGTPAGGISIESPLLRLDQGGADLRRHAELRGRGVHRHRRGFASDARSQSDRSDHAELRGRGSHRHRRGDLDRRP